MTETRTVAVLICDDVEKYVDYLVAENYTIRRYKLSIDERFVEITFAI
jgi:hypothetical protein